MLLKSFLKLFCIALLLISLTNTAQTKMKDTLVVDVVKSFQPTLSAASKINDNPAVQDSTIKIAAIDYKINSYKVNTNFAVDAIKPAKMVGEPLFKIYRSTLKFGLGNYTTPYAEYFYNGLRSKEYLYGMHLYHLSSSATLKNAGFSGFSDNIASLYAKKFLKKHTLFGDINYSRNVIHYYGYNADLFALSKDSIKQRYSLVSPSIGIISHFKDSSKINYITTLKYSNLSDVNKVKEDNINVDATFRKFIEKELIIVNTSVDHYVNKFQKDTLNNSIISLNPSINSEGNKWKASLGLSAVLDINTTNAFYFYPNIDFNYFVVENIFIPYAGVAGGLTKNSYRSLTQTNAFLISNPALKNTDKKYDIYAGIKGTIEKNTSFNAKVSYAQINNLPLYVIDTTNILQNTFNLFYDNSKVLNLHAELAHQKLEKYRVAIKADYFNYDMQTQEFPWHLPNFNLGLTANYNLRNKIVLKSDLFLIGKRYSILNSKQNNVTVITKKLLKPITDINIGAEYRYTKRLSAFVQLNNIAAMRYYQWDNYPSQRINFILGASYIF